MMSNSRTSCALGVLLLIDTVDTLESGKSVFLYKKIGGVPKGTPPIFYDCEQLNNKGNC